MDSQLSAPRHYQGERDLEMMLALLQDGRAAGASSYYVHTGDLKWWLYYPPLGAAWWDTIYLWEDPGAADCLLGWVLLDPAGETFDIYPRPELLGTSLAIDMLNWGEMALEKIARAAGRDQLGMYWTPHAIFPFVLSILLARCDAPIKWTAQRFPPYCSD